MIALPQVARPLRWSHKFVIASSTVERWKTGKRIRKGKASADSAAASLCRPKSISISMSLITVVPPFACDPSNEVYDRLSAPSLPSNPSFLFLVDPLLAATGHLETSANFCRRKGGRNTHTCAKLRCEYVGEMNFDKKFVVQSPSSSNGLSAGVPKLAQPRDHWPMFRGLCKAFRGDVAQHDEFVGGREF